MPSPRPNAPPGKHFDHLRDSSPVVQSQPDAHSTSKWADFARPFAGEGTHRSHVADEEWWEANMPDYEDPSQVGHNEEKDIPGFWLFTPEKRMRTRKKLRVRQTSSERAKTITASILGDNKRQTFVAKMAEMTSCSMPTLNPYSTIH